MNARTGWWHSHRLLRRGSQGPDVVRLQRQLNLEGWSDFVEPSGRFDSKTESVVIKFQEGSRLVADGIAGPVTQSVLFGESLRYELAKPRFVRQGHAYLCWAACLESVLGSSWPGRARQSMADLRRNYQSYLTAQGAISLQGLQRAARDLRFQEVLMGGNVRASSLMPLLRTRRPLLIVDNSTGSVMHTRVLYGIHISRGAIDLLLMDPLSGYTRLPIGDLQVLTRFGFFSAQ